MSGDLSGEPAPQVILLQVAEGHFAGINPIVRRAHGGILGRRVVQDPDATGFWPSVRAPAAAGSWAGAGGGREW